MKEYAVIFGTGNSLAGIVTEAAGSSSNSRKPVVIFWNAGLLHRVGPFRLYVDLARRLSAMGFWVLRFDLSGKGDSEVRKENILEEERAIIDIQDAMDFMNKKAGKDAFVLVGLCSGADEAFPAAVKDERVVGVVLLDAFGYRTLGFYLTHYLPRLFRWSPWRNFIVRTVARFLPSGERDGDQKNARKEETFVRFFPPRAKAKAELIRLMERGASFLFVYSGGVREDYYNYKGQFYQMFWPLKAGDELQVEYFRDAAHIYTRQSDRKMLSDCICDWLQRRHSY